MVWWRESWEARFTGKQGLAPLWLTHRRKPWHREGKKLAQGYTARAV